MSATPLEGYTGAHTPGEQCPCDPQRRIEFHMGDYRVVLAHQAPTEVIGGQEMAAEILRAIQMPESWSNDGGRDPSPSPRKPPTPPPVRKPPPGGAGEGKAK